MTTTNRYVHAVFEVCRTIRLSEHPEGPRSRHARPWRPSTNEHTIAAVRWEH